MNQESNDFNQENLNIQTNSTDAYNSNLQNSQPVNQMAMKQLANGKNNSKLTKVFAIIGGIAVGVIALAVGVILFTTATSKKLVCKSNLGNITIMYNKSGITGYTSKGMGYNLKQQQGLAKEMGIDAYLAEFNEWFKNNTSGTCTIDGKEFSS